MGTRLKAKEGTSNPFKLPRGERIRRELVRFFRTQRQRILLFARTGRKDLGGAIPTAWPNWTDLGVGTIELSKRMTPLISLAWDAAGSKFLSKIGLDPDDWRVTNPHTAAAIQSATLAFCEATNQTTSLAIDDALAKTREALHEGIITEGDGLPWLTKKINKIFDGAETWRARRIAWTETSRAVHAAQEQAAIESGVVTGWQWLLSSDACGLCVAIAARCPAVRLGHAFAVVGNNPHYSQVKYPPAHPHCNCTVVEVLDTDEQPAFHQTLHQPEPATDEETEKIGKELAERDEGILSGKPPKPQKPIKPKPVPPKPHISIPLPPEAFELPARNPVEPTPGEAIPEEEEPPKKPKKPKPPSAPRKPVAPPFPKDPDALEVVRMLGGSTGAKLVKDKKGRLYVLKGGANAGHIREEDAADRIYRSLGIDVPRSKLYETPYGPVKLSEFHEGKTLGELKHSDHAAYLAAVEQLKKGFVADALLGNWDVIGSGGDNVLVTPAGKVLRIDNGGSLRYRAQGALKSPTQWGNFVGELASLRNPGINPDAASVFQDVTDDEIKAQAKALQKKRLSIRKQAPLDVRDTLAQRIDYLKEYTKPPKVIKGWKPTPEHEFYRPATLSDAQQWADRHYPAAFGRGLSGDEKRAISDYTGSGYASLNRSLRSNPAAATTNPTVAHLDSAVSKRPLPEGVIAYRQFSLSSAGYTTAQLKPGFEITDTAFTSTTLKPGGTWHGQLFEVRIPKGTPAIWVNSVGSYSSHPSENELLLGREANRFRVVEAKPDRVIVEIVPEKPKRRKKP